MKKVILILLIIICLLIIGLAIFPNKNNEKIETVSMNSNHNEFISKLVESCVNSGYETILNLESDDNQGLEMEEEFTISNEKTNDSTKGKSTSKEIPYYIKVNYQQNVVTIYGKDENGNYTKPVKAMLCSTGSATPTSGTYSISSKYTWLPLFGGVYGQYSTRIVGHILFHSVPYQIKGDKGSLEYWEYDKLGTSASAGCIRLTVQDAKWIYSNCTSGTKVEFYADSNPGPLGKPTAQKISSEESVRNWDPTDPDANNPWKTYNKKENNQNNNKPSNTIENTIDSNNTVNNVIDNNINNSLNNNINNNTIDNTNKGNTINSDNKNTIGNTIEDSKNNTINNNTINNNTINNNTNKVEDNKNNTINDINSNIINNIA